MCVCVCVRVCLSEHSFQRHSLLTLHIHPAPQIRSLEDQLALSMASEAESLNREAIVQQDFKEQAERAKEYMMKYQQEVKEDDVIGVKAF